MTTQSLRRGSAVLAAAALGASVLGVAAAPAQAADGDTTGRTAGAATWIVGQLGDDALLPSSFDPATPDYGLTIDAGLSLAATGEQPAAVERISDAIAANLDSYITGDAFGDPGSTYSGAAAKALVFSQVAGADPADYDDGGLVERVEGVVDDTTGRSADVSGFGDFANTIGQSFVVRGLNAEGSAEAAAATDFLLQQQCSEGFFRLGFSAAEAADQTCDGDPDAAPDTDVTAFALLALVEQAGDPEVDAAIESGVAWLEETQAEDGSFGGGVATEAPNSNSTGLAGQALAEAGADEAAGAAAAYVAALQVPATCEAGPLATEAGAVAYDPAAFETGETEGITEALGDQWRRTTAQAFPVLQYVPGAAGKTDLRLVGPRGFVRAGSLVTLTVQGLGAGDTACVYNPSSRATATAAAPTVRLVAPRGTTRRIFTAVWLGRPATTAVQVLDKKALVVGLGKKQVKRGAAQVIRVRGLAAGERVVVKLRNKVVARGTASPAGRFNKRVVVRGAAPAKAKVVVVGQYNDRRGSATFRVVR